MLGIDGSLGGWVGNNDAQVRVWQLCFMGDHVYVGQ